MGKNEKIEKEKKQIYYNYIIVILRITIYAMINFFFMFRDECRRYTCEKCSMDCVNFWINRNHFLSRIRNQANAWSSNRNEKRNPTRNSVKCLNQEHQCLPSVAIVYIFVAICSGNLVTSPNRLIVSMFRIETNFRKNLHPSNVQNMVFNPHKQRGYRI